MTEKKESKASSSPYEVPGHPVERGTTDFYIKFFSHFIFIFIFLVMVPTILIGICLSFWVSPLVLGATGYIFYRMIKKRLNVLNNMSDEEYDACFTKEFVPPFKMSGKPVKRGSFAYYLNFSLFSFIFISLTVIAPSIAIACTINKLLGFVVFVTSGYFAVKKEIKFYKVISELTEDEYNSCFGHVFKNNHMQDYFIEQQNRCPLGSLSLEHVTNTASASYNLYGPGSNNPY